ncbi:MAG: YbjN domain-containing protein [Spirochaetes bacterium]|nr:YbjN domain-containing protein [Spirochaetota bacterium]
MDKIEKSQVYDDPVLGIRETASTEKYWEKTQDSYSKKKYKDAIINLLNYLDPELVKTYGNKDQTEFSIPNGSLMVNISLKDNKFSVNAPFLKLPEKKVNVLLRQLSEINFMALFLSQIGLKGDELYFKYSTELELCEPYKIYDVLYEICINGDYYDDIFIDEMGAKRLKEMEVKDFSKAQKEKAWKMFNEYIDESLQHLEYFGTNRWFGPGLDSARITLMKMDYLLQPQGLLVSDIQKILNSSWNNGRLNLNEVFDKTKEDIRKLKEWDQKKFNENVYIPKFLISPKKRASLMALQDIMRPDYDSAKRYVQEFNFFESAHFCLYAIYNLFFRNTIPIKVEGILNDALKKASGKKFEEASGILLKILDKVMAMK